MATANAGARTLVYVNITPLNFKYGFPASEKKFKAYGSILGQVEYNGQLGVFFGGNSPKPGLATKSDKSGRITSKFSDNKANTLKKQGWTVKTGGNVKGIKSDGKAVTVAVSTPFPWDYAWNTPKSDLSKVLALGAQIPTNPNRLVWGPTIKPPRATIRLSSNRTFSCFVPPDLNTIEEALKKGYRVESPDPDWGL